MGVGRVCRSSRHFGNPLHVGVAGSEQFVGTVRYPACGVGVGRSTVWRVVLEAPITRRVVRRRDDDAIRVPNAIGSVVRQDRQRDRRCRHKTIRSVNHHRHAVRGQNFERRGMCRFGQGVSVLTDEQRSLDPLAGSVLTDGLGCRRDVGVVETRVQRRSTVARRAEAHLLARIIGVGCQVVISRQQGGNVDEIVGKSGLSGALVHGGPQQFRDSGWSNEVRRIRESRGSRGPTPPTSSSRSPYASPSSSSSALPSA